METGKSPLHWPVTLYSENETELLPIVLMATTVYTVSCLYYSLQWKRGIFSSKYERYVSCLSCLLTECTLCETIVKKDKKRSLREYDSKDH